MNTNDLKDLFLEREQQFSEALARCRGIEHMPEQVLDKLESIFQELLTAQEQVFEGGDQ